MSKQAFAHIRQISLSFLNVLDNQKSYLPRLIEPGKKSSRIFHLPSKITGTIMWNSRYPQNRKVKMFVNHNNFEQGGSKVS